MSARTDVAAGSDVPSSEVPPSEVPPSHGAGAVPGLDERLDRLTAQVDRISALLLAQQEDRERRQALVHELTGVAQGAMTVASRELEDLSADVTVEDAVRFLRTATRTLPRLEVMLTWAASIEELVTELTALSGAGMATLSDALGRAESRGYFDAARAGGLIADRMAAAVLIEPAAEPPSALALLRRLRDPQVRRGLDLALTLVQALGAPRIPGGGPRDGRTPDTTTTRPATMTRPATTPEP